MNELVNDDNVLGGEFYKSAISDMNDLINVTNVLDRVSRGI